METGFLIFEIIGTVAFAASGALTGIKKHMDVFGVAILGLVTAVGGGVIRDIILGITPPVTFHNPIYVLVAVSIAIIAFLPYVRKKLAKSNRVYETIMLIMDSVGLGVFTVVGIKTAYGAIPDCTIFLLIFVGVVTGVGGGIMRDVLAGDTPYIFVKHIYASASLVGALLCVALWETVTPVWAMMWGMAVIIVVRLLSAHFRWNLPKA